MDKNVSAFLDHVKKECEKHDVKLTLRNVKYFRLSPKVTCGGYFDDVNKELACSTNREDWLDLLVHEYAHMTQWLDRDNCVEWMNEQKFKSLEKLDEWLNGKTKYRMKFHLGVCRDLELDNEKRTVELIKKFGLQKHIDIDFYTKKANAYVLFYNYMNFTRRWCNTKNPFYKNNELIKKMSNKFDMNYNELDSHIKLTFDKCKI
jgi:hypothetical protein